MLDILLVFFLALTARDPVSLAELAEHPTLESHHESAQDTSLVDIHIRILESVSSEGDLLAPDQGHRPGLGEEVKKFAIPKKDRAIVRVLRSVNMFFFLTDNTL
jgi:hypothetical protein